jgi:hypothetical protein
MIDTKTAVIAIEIEICCQPGCGVLFGMERGYRAERIRAKDSFYCPNGHKQHYLGKSDAQLAREASEALARERAAHDQTGAALNEATKRAASAARKLSRVQRGVCPHCNRTFGNLARHMAVKHEKKRRK